MLAISAERRRYVIAVVFLFAGFVLIFRSSASSGLVESRSRPGDYENPAQQKPPAASCPSCSPAKDRVIYAPLFDLPESSGSEIVLNCRSGERDVPVTPTFYTLDGKA